MGVPGLFYWLQNKYPEFFQKVRKTRGSVPKTVDNLYVDAVCFVHTCAQHVYCYGAGALRAGEEVLSEKERERWLFEMVRDAIFRLTRLVQPTKRFIVAFDGVAPMAKQNQQRQRRFLAAMDSEGKEFNPNCITCGTDFMTRLQRFVRTGLEYKTAKAKYSLVFSDSTLRAEGEHKLLNLARSYGGEESHCFFSPDGDLVLLSMGLKFPKTFLLREDHNAPWQHIFCDMTASEKALSADVPIDDLLLLSNFLGNDFLPRLVMFEGKFSESMETLIEEYKKFGKRLVTSDMKLEKKNAYEFFRIIGTKEQEMLEKRSYFEINFQKPERVDKTLLSCFDPTKGLDLEKYKDVFNDSRLLGRQDDALKQYIRGMVWVINYYTSGCPDDSWLYPFPYPPFLSDLKEEHVVVPRFVDKCCTNLLLQLLCVLPPSSFSVLPRKWRKYDGIYKDPRIAEFYPKEFEIDREGKTRDYECVALLPFVDTKVLRTIMAERE